MLITPDEDGVRIFESYRRDKKYVAILPNGKAVHFGQRGYQQYEDRTPLKLYSDLDHHDEKRRETYYKRHAKDYPKYSADWFSKKYLW